MRWSRKIILIGSGLLIGILLCEGLARCFLPYPHRQIALLRMRAPDMQIDAKTNLKNPTYNPFLQRRPHCNWICDGKTPESMNNEGFRDQDFVIPKKTDCIRIAILGDSFVEGWMGPRQAAFPRVLGSKLGPSYEVMNWGLANRSPARYLSLYDQIIRKYQPDVVLVCLFRNDLGEDETVRPYITFDNQEIPVHFDFERYVAHTPPMPRTKWEKRLDKWQWHLCSYSRLFPYVAVQLVEPEFRKRILESPPPSSFDKNWLRTSSYLLTLKNLVEKDKTRYLLAYIPDLEDFQKADPLKDTAEQFAIKNKIPYFNASSFLAAPDPASFYIPGDGHFSVEGNLLYANGLYDWLRPLIESLIQSNTHH